MSSKKITINIWDDYPEDGYVPEGKIQETYAYVEGGDLNDDDERSLLEELQKRIESIKGQDSALTCNVTWFDSAELYPNLVGTEHGMFLTKQWQLQLKHIPHRERERIVDALDGAEFEFNGKPVVVYSES